VEVLHLDPYNIHLVLFNGNGAMAMRHLLAAINSKNSVTCSEILNIKIIFQNIIKTKIHEWQQSQK
jgi:hypothetical protein